MQGHLLLLYGGANVCRKTYALPAHPRQAPSRMRVEILAPWLYCLISFSQEKIAKASRSSLAHLKTTEYTTTVRSC